MSISSSPTGFTLLGWTSYFVFLLDHYILFMDFFILQFVIFLLIHGNS